MNRKLWITTIVFALAAGLVWWLISRDKQDVGSKYPDRNFAVSDTAVIGKIFLANKDGGSLLVERSDDGGWLVNGKYKGFNTTVQVLLETVSTMTVKYIPPQAATEYAIRNIASNGIKVEVYDRKGRRIRHYYVGGNTSDDLGTYCIVDGYEQLYVMHLPQLYGGIRSRFTMQEKDMIERVLFKEDPDQITEVMMEYPGYKNNSFVLKKEGAAYNVRPYHEITPVISGTVQQSSVEAFLTGFQFLSAEAVINDFPQKDSVLNQIPFCYFSVGFKDGSKKSLKLYPIFDLVSEDPEKVDNPQEEIIVERYYAYSELDGMFYLVQDQMYRKVFWGYPFFFEVQSPAQPMPN